MSADSAALLDQVWYLLANDATFLGYFGWTTALSQSAAAGATQLVVNESVRYLSGETVKVSDGSGGWITTTITQTGTGTMIPINALPSAASSGATAESYLTPTSSVANKVGRIVKEEETDGIVDNTTIPMCLMYIRPGHADHRTLQAYYAKVVVDCYASTGNTSRQMIAQAHTLMHNWRPPNISAYVCRSAYDTSFKTGITGVKGHRKYFDVLTYVG